MPENKKSHFQERNEYISSIKKENEFGKTIFEKEKEKQREIILTRMTKAYEKALLTLEGLSKKIKEVQRPSSSHFQSIGDSKDKVKVCTFSEEQEKTLKTCKENQAKLNNLLDKFFENSTIENVQKLEEATQKVKI